MRDLGKRTLFVAVALVLSASMASADLVENNPNNLAFLIFADPANGGIFTGSDLTTGSYTVVRVMSFNSEVFTQSGFRDVTVPPAAPVDASQSGFLPSAGTALGSDGFPVTFGTGLGQDLGFRVMPGQEFIIAGFVQHDGGQFSMITGSQDDEFPPPSDDVLEGVYLANFAAFAAGMPARVDTRTGAEVFGTLFGGSAAMAEDFAAFGKGTVFAIDMVDDTTFVYTPGFLTGQFSMSVNHVPPNIFIPFESNLVDTLTFSNSFGQTKDNKLGVPGAPPVIPEPVSFLLCALGAGLVLRRKKAA